MNTNPDEARLALWLDDELHGEELAAFEAWVAGHPEHFAAREEVRRWRGMIRSHIPAVEDVPYPDFFQSRVAREIRKPTVVDEPAARPARAFSWRSLAMPLAACAGMAFTFWVGTRQARSGPPEIDVTGAPKAIPVEPILYTPEKGVEAEWFTSTKASATVIVLNGVQAIPDATDFLETAMQTGDRELDSTASLEPEPRTAEIK